MSKFMRLRQLRWLRFKFQLLVREDTNQGFISYYSQLHF